MINPGGLTTIESLTGRDRSRDALKGSPRFTGNISFDEFILETFYEDDPLTPSIIFAATNLDATVFKVEYDQGVDLRE